MPSTVTFSPKTAELIDELKEYYGVNSTKALVEKAIMLTSVLASEAGESHKIMIQGRNGEPPFMLLLR